jgi:hypothetical protein
MWKTSSTIVGASPRKSAANIQDETKPGRARRNSLRSVRATKILGRRERSAPGCRDTVSGELAMETSPTTAKSARVPKTSGTGAVPYCTAIPLRKAPTPRPAADAPETMTAAIRLRDSGARSTTAAVMALVSAPVAAPCTMRAVMTQPIDGAMRNSPIARTSTMSEPMMTERRPMKSESPPTVSSAASRASAYAANATVSKEEEKCHRSWSITRTGVGAPAAR